MNIEFSNKVCFPMIAAYSRTEQVSSMNDIIGKSEREVLELHFDSSSVSLTDLEPYFTDLNEKASVIKISEGISDADNAYIYTDYVIPIKFSREYIEGDVNPRIIMTVGRLSETDKTLRDIAPTIKVYTGTPLEIAKAKKIDEMDKICEQTIFNGSLVPLSNGMTEKFTLDNQDQLNLSGIALKILMGSQTVAWHSDDETEACKFYSAADAKTIISTLTAFKEYHITYFRDLRIYIYSLDTIESVESIYYGAEIPEEYKSDVLKQAEALI